MKTLTCKDVGGACDFPLSGSTLDEIGQKCKAHVMETQDDAHRARLEAWKAMPKEEQTKQWQDFVRKFNEAPDL